MNSRIFGVSAALVAAGLLGAGTMANAANLIVNGNFDTGNLTGWSGIGNFIPSENYVSSGLSTVGDQYSVSPYNGANYMLSLGNYNNQGFGGVYQYFNTKPGATYQVNFAFNDNGSISVNGTALCPGGNGAQCAGSSDSNQEARVLIINSVGGLEFENDFSTAGVCGGPLGSRTWCTADQVFGTTTEQFTATGTRSYIVIEGYGATGYNNFDAVSVSAVPLPGALPLFGSAIVGIGALTRRRAMKSAKAA
jgi:hypothetical protein